jgi:hypothetical protein
MLSSSLIGLAVFSAIVVLIATVFGARRSAGIFIGFIAVVLAVQVLFGNVAAGAFAQIAFSLLIPICLLWLSAKLILSKPQKNSLGISSDAPINAN